MLIFLVTHENWKNSLVYQVLTAFINKNVESLHLLLVGLKKEWKEIEASAFCSSQECHLFCSPNEILIRLMMYLQSHINSWPASSKNFKSQTACFSPEIFYLRMMFLILMPSHTWSTSNYFWDRPNNSSIYYTDNDCLGMSYNLLTL